MNDKCSIDAATLSAYYDNELSGQHRISVEKHIATCPSCQNSLRRLQELSAMADRLSQVNLDPELYGSIDLRIHSPSPGVRPWSLAKRMVVKWSVAAVAVVLVVSLLTMWLGHGHISHRIADFSPYLNRFPGSPELAVEYFVANHHGQPIQRQEADQVEGFSPIVSDALETEYAPRQFFLLDMPCCRCVCGTYQHPDGHIVHVFQHARDQAVSFGNNPVIVSNCHGRNCRVVQVDGVLAVNWPTPTNRSITVVGAKGIEEVAHIVNIIEQRHE